MAFASAWRPLGAAGWWRGGAQRAASASRPSLTMPADGRRMAKPPAKGPTATAKIGPRTWRKDGLRTGSNPGSWTFPDTVPKTTTSPTAVTGLPDAPGGRAPAVEGTPAAATFRLITLKRRSEFLRVRKGARSAAPSFVVEAKARPSTESATAVEGARF